MQLLIKLTPLVLQHLIQGYINAPTAVMKSQSQGVTSFHHKTINNTALLMGISFGNFSFTLFKTHNQISYNAL